MNTAIAGPIKVGVGVWIVCDGLVLLGRRKSSQGKNCWAPPGGHLEVGETPPECAKRELLEETGLDALSLREGPWTNELEEGEHYVSIHILVETFRGTPQNLEPQKCHGWEWRPIDPSMDQLFVAARQLMEKYPLETLKSVRV